MSTHTFKDALELSAARTEEIGAPVAKYSLSIHITANSHAELDQRIRFLCNDWDYSYANRDTIDSTDGTTSIVQLHSNPEQTPEAYNEALQVWSAERRKSRVVVPVLGESTTTETDK